MLIRLQHFLQLNIINSIKSTSVYTPIRPCMYQFFILHLHYLFDCIVSKISSVLFKIRNFMWSVHFFFTNIKCWYIRYYVYNFRQNIFYRWDSSELHLLGVGYMWCRFFYHKSFLTSNFIDITIKLHKTTLCWKI